MEALEEKRAAEENHRRDVAMLAQSLVPRILSTAAGSPEISAREFMLVLVLMVSLRVLLGKQRYSREKMHQKF